MCVCDTQVLYSNYKHASSISMDQLENIGVIVKYESRSESDETDRTAKNKKSVRTHAEVYILNPDVS